METNKKSSFGKNIIIIGAGTSISKLMSILLVGLYTAHLSPEDYGYFDILFTVISMSIPLITLQISDGLYRNLLDAKSKSDISRCVSSSVVVLIAGLIIGVIILCIVNLAADIRMGWLLPGYAVTSAIYIYSQQAARGVKRNIVFASSGLIYTAVMTGFNLWFIIGLQMSAEALIISIIIADIAAIIFLEIAVGVFRRIKLRQIDTQLIKSMCRYSVPLLPQVMMWWLLLLVNRAVINSVLGPEYNGIFAISSKFPGLLIAIFNAFGLAWQESAIAEYNSAERDAYYSKTFSRYMRLLFSSLLILIPLTRYLAAILVGEDFSDAWLYIPVLYIGSIFSAFAQFFGTGYLGAKKTLGMFITTSIGVTSGLSLLFLLPQFGLHAAALAQTASYVFVFLARVVHTRRFFKIKVEWGIMALVFALTGAYLFGYYYGDWRIDIGMLAVAAAVFALINRDLIKGVLSALKSSLRRGGDAA